MKHSIYLRNFLSTALIVLLSFLILGGLSTTLNYRLSTSEKNATMTATLQETALYVITQHVYNGVDISNLNLSMWMAMISGVSGFDLLLTDTEGVVCACSDKDFRHLGKTIPSQAITAVMSGRDAVTVSTLGQTYAQRRQVAGAPLGRTINDETVVFGYLFVSSDYAAYRQTWRQFSGVFTLIAINVMALTFVISFLTTKKQAEPLNEMASAARRFAHGELSARVEDQGRCDEIGQLTQAFNAMADSLEKSETLRREFIANLSHELKTPMTVIAGFAEGIIDGTIPRENETRYLSVISSETRRLSRLVKSMLEISTIRTAADGALTESSFDASEVVRLALLSLGSKIEDKQLEVAAELPEEPVMTRGDKDSITQVVYNLIDNAIKFSTPGGEIKAQLWKQGGRAYVSVGNRGETILQDELPHIFDRFHKADKSRSANRDGVGLGLYIVKTILDAHKENIFVTSSGGVTKFVFTLTIV